MDKNQHSRKRGLETRDNVKTNTGETSKWRVPKIGRSQPCYFYKPDNCEEEDITMVFEVSFCDAKSAIPDEKKSACYFGSALCAFCPDLTTIVMDALEENGIKPEVITLPSDSTIYGVNVFKNSFEYDAIKIYTIVGSCLIMLFMNNVNMITDEFMRDTVQALAKKLRMPEDTIYNFEEGILPALAKVIYNVFGTHDALKKEVEEFLTWLSKRKDKSHKMAIMASFVLEWKNKFD